jgi:colanic acid biosynthesis glycosyl transferase WcaI
MRITFVNRYFFPDISATSQLLTELAEDLDAKGETITVITGNTSYVTSESLPAYGTHHGICIKRVGFSRFGRSQVLGRLADYCSFWICAFWKAVRLKDQDCLVVLSDPPILSLFAAMVRVFNPVSTVCWLQDVFPDIAIRAGVIREGLVAHVLSGLATWSLRQMDRIIVIGRCMNQQLLSRGLSPIKITIIPNWADGAHIRSIMKKDNVFRSQHYLQGRFVIMYSGNHGLVHEFDAIAQLIRATRTVLDLSFCFIGEGAWKQRLIQMSWAEGWSHAIFLPYQPKAELESSLAAADVHLVSLREGMEGLCVPSKLYGVLAAARPVIFIGPAESEVAQVIREAGCGSTVAPGDTDAAVKTLLTLYHDRSLLESEGRAARDYFDRHCNRALSTERFRQMLHRIRELPVAARDHIRSPLTTEPRLQTTDAEPLA